AVDYLGITPQCLKSTSGRRVLLYLFRRSIALMLSWQSSSSTTQGGEVMRNERRKFLGQGLGGMAGLAMGGIAFPSVSMAADAIKVGVLLDLSGPLQLFGTVKAQCLRLAAEEINANGGLLGR